MPTDQKFTKANITKDTIKIINRIAAEEDKYIYTIIEEAIRKVHPEYFKNDVKAKEESKKNNNENIKWLENSKNDDRKPRDCVQDSREALLSL